MSVDVDEEAGFAPDAAPARARKAWTPEADAETAALLRHLAAVPWLVGGRDDALIAAVRRNETALRDTLGRLGWVLVVEHDLVRLRKSPPVRPEAWAGEGPPPATCSWFFLLAAAAEAMPPRVGLGRLVTAARAAAAEAGLPNVGDIAERRAIAAALRLMDQRGVLETVDGDLEVYVRSGEAPVLIAVHHTRLAHVIANPGTLNPAADPAAWLAQVQRENDPARRMRRRLVDDTCVHTCELDEAEAQWLSQRVRGDDGTPLATAFGLRLERRSEGAAFVVPDDAFRHPRELGPLAFPATGTVAHAALLLCDLAEASGRVEGGPGSGWRGLPANRVHEALRGFADTNATGRGGWSREYVDDIGLLADRVARLLNGLNVLRVESQLISEHCDDAAQAQWWFAPTTSRWAAPGTAAPKTTKRSHGLSTLAYSGEADQQPALFTIPVPEATA